MSIDIKQGDAATVLATMPSESVQCAITSPPYWGLRDYGVTGQLGLEKTPDEYVAHLVEVFREVWRVLRDDGTLWLNLGDSYAANRGYQVPDSKWGDVGNNHGSSVPAGLKPKDLVGIPWMVAFALRADRWYLRSDIIWSKPNPMPESVTDRPTKAHEYVFLLSKSAAYYYDSFAIAEPLTRPDEANRKTPARFGGADKWEEAQKQSRLHSGNEYKGTPTGTRNRRTVWTISTAPYKGAHFATFPPKLVEPMVLAGAPVAGVVLDPFCGSGTVGAVCVTHSRSFIGIELNPAYITLANERIAKAQANDPQHLRDCGATLPEIAKKLNLTIPQVARLLA